MKRREFLAATGSLALVAACGGDDGNSDDVDAGAIGFTVINVDNSMHEHTLTILCIDLAGEAPITYRTGSGDGHTHSVMLTADEVMRIAAGETVTINFTDGHAHSYMIAKPAGDCE